MTVLGFFHTESKADLSDSGGQADEAIPWTPGRIRADPNLNLVYVINESNKQVRAYNTENGTLKSFGSTTRTLTDASLEFSIDGSKIYASIPNWFSGGFVVFQTDTLVPIQAPNGSGFKTSSFIVGSDTRHYLIDPDTGKLTKDAPYLNTIYARLDSPTFRHPNKLIRSSDGSRFFVMETATDTGNGNGCVTELAVQSGLGADPLVVSFPFDTCASGRDLEFDESSDLLYRVSAGEPGIAVWDLDTETQTTSDDGEYFAVEQRAGSTHVFGTTVDPDNRGYVRKIRKSDGLPEWEYQISGPGSGLADGTPVEESLAVLPNGHLFYVIYDETTGYTLGLIRPAPGVGQMARPSQLAATDGVHLDKIALSWQGTVLATDYLVYRGTDPDPANATEIATVSIPSFDDPSVIPGETYYYWIKASSGGVTSEFSRGDEGFRLEEIPDVPANVSATDGTFGSKVVITWDVAPRTRTYNIFRNTENSTAGATLLGTTTDTTWTDLLLPAPLVDYYYWVTATNTGGESGYSDPDMGQRSIAVPSATTGVNASDGTSLDVVNLSWSPHPDATSYHVYRYHLNDSSLAVVAGTTSETTFTLLSLSPGTSYFFWVRAQNQNGPSAFGTPDIGYRKALPAPTNLLATDGTSTTAVYVTWDPVEGADSYDVYRSTDDNFDNAARRKTTTDPDYRDYYNNEPGVHYYYWVRARRTPTGFYQNSAFTGPEVGYEDFPPPSRPLGVTATNGTLIGKTVISWNAVTAADSYKIFWNSVNDSETASQLASGITETTWEDTSIALGELRYYWVVATNDIGDSTFSPSAQGRAKAPAPTGLQVTQGTAFGRVSISWTAAPGVTQYRIHRATNPNGPYNVKIGVFATSSDDSFMLTPGQQYYYRVQSFPGGVEDGASDLTDIEIGWAALHSPINLTATDGLYQGSVELEWEAVAHAADYEVFRGTAPDGSDAVLAGTTSDTSYTDSAGTPGQQFYYFVKAKSGAVRSEFSTGETGHGTSGPPFQPDGLIGKSGGGQLGGDIYGPSGIGQMQILVSKKVRPVTFGGTLENDGETADEFTVIGSRGNRLFKLIFLGDSGNESAALLTGLATGVMPPGAKRNWNIVVKPSRKLRNRRTKKIKKKAFTASLTAISKADNTRIDQVRAFTKTK